jgi:hypothetical protein
MPPQHKTHTQNSKTPYPCHRQKGSWADMQSVRPINKDQTALISLQKYNCQKASETDATPRRTPERACRLDPGLLRVAPSRACYLGPAARLCKRFLTRSRHFSRA